MMDRIVTNSTVGDKYRSLMWKNWYAADAPSTSATSSSSRGILLSAAMNKIMLYPRFFHKNSTTMTTMQ